MSATRETATLAAEIAAPAAVVRDLILDQPGHASWFPQMQRVERLPDDTASRLPPPPAPATPVIVWRHIFAFTVLQIRVDPPANAADAPITWHVADERGHFTAIWRFDIEPLADDRCRVTLTENRTAIGSLARLWQRLFLRPDHYIRKYLTALAAAAVACHPPDC